MIKLRCSSLDSLWTCTPSVLTGGLIQITVGGKVEANKGKAVHECLADYVDTGTCDIPQTASRAGLDDWEEIAESVQYGIKAWEEVKKYLPEPRTECVVTAEPLATSAGVVLIEGTVDVLSPKGESSAVFLDWKNGYVDDGYHNQMAGYAYSTWVTMGRPDDAKIVGIVVFLRHRYYRVVHWDKAKLEAWEYDLTHNVLSRPELFAPGGHCGYCSKYADCKARKTLVHNAIDAFLGRDGVDPEYLKWLGKAKDILSVLTPANKGEENVGTAISQMLHMVKMVETECENVRELVREAVGRVGSVPTVNGCELVMREVPIRSLDAGKALPVLRRRLSDTQIMQATKLSLTKLLASYVSNVLRGEKTAAKEQLETELVQAGAVNVTVQRRLDEVESSIPESVNVSTVSDGTQPLVAGNVAGQPAVSGTNSGPLLRGGGLPRQDGGGDAEAVGTDAPAKPAGRRRTRRGAGKAAAGDAGGGVAAGDAASQGGGADGACPQCGLPAAAGGKCGQPCG